MIHFNQQKLKIMDERHKEPQPISKEDKRKNKQTLKKYGDQIIICPICGLKGVERHWHLKSGREQVLISHPTSILRLDDPTIIKPKKTKQCFLGDVSTDTWDLPRSDEGYQIILIQLIEGLETIINKWNQKSPKTKTYYITRAKELQKIVDVYQKFKPTISQMEGLK